MNVHDKTSYLLISGLTVEERTLRGTSSTSISRADQKKACDHITKQLRTQRSNVVGNVTGKDSDFSADSSAVEKGIKLKLDICALDWCKKISKMSRETEAKFFSLHTYSCSKIDL